MNTLVRKTQSLRRSALKSCIDKWSQQEQLNFLLTNRIPRRWATLFVGWFSRIENPLVREISLRIWKLFADDLRLYEAKTIRFKSMHDCFIRELAPGTRKVDHNPNVLSSPCDAIVGAHGKIDGTEVFQAKGFPYSLEDLLPDSDLVDRYCRGIFITLRLKSNMYHRFHAPCDGRINRVTYISGDTWNVNPVALRRIERLFCKNERAVLTIEGGEDGNSVTLVPVAAILVASMQFHFLDHPLDLRYKGPNEIACDHVCKKGDELGYFQHGSTIIAFASTDYCVESQICEGQQIQMGQPLLRRLS